MAYPIASHQYKLETRVGTVILDARKVAFLPETQTLLIADMHFEKGSYLRHFGRSSLPAYDTQDTIERLIDITKDYAPKHIIALGDSFHDIAADQRLSSNSAASLNTLCEIGGEMIWVLGNHDPDIPNAVKGAREDHAQIDGFLLTHHPHSMTEGTNICGHYHPKAKISSKAGSVSAPCFAISQDRIIMPSFGTYTGGLWVTDLAFKEAMPNLDCVALTYENRIFKIQVTSGFKL